MGRPVEHGMSFTPEYRAWRGMRKRCRPDWYKRHLYYDRGIRVYPPWEHDFPAFLAEVGLRPEGFQLDRIEGSKGYEPGNVRWADLSTQRRNQRPRGPGYNKPRGTKNRNHEDRERHAPETFKKKDQRHD